MSAGKVVLLVLGSGMLLVGVALLLAGGAVMVLERGFTDADGFLLAPEAGLTRDTYAIVGEVAFEGDWIWWYRHPTEVRIRIAADRPLFIGIGAPDEVRAYLSEVSYSEIRRIDSDEYWKHRTWRADYRDRIGADVPVPPGDLDFWLSRIEGAGELTLDWPIEPGDWMFVVMNADGARGIEATAAVGVRAPWLSGVGIGLLVAGALAVAGGLTLVLHVARRARTASPAPPAPVAEAPRRAFPLTLQAELTEPLSPALWLVKWFLLIPHAIVLGFLWSGFAFSWLASLVAILFTGRYPRGLFDYNVGVLRWTWRVAFYGYDALGTDRYPPFSLKPGGYPADLDVPYPERLSRGLVLVKWWLLAIPHFIVLGLLQGGAGFYQVGLACILTVFAGVFLLFTGRYPRDIFRLVVGMNRWTFRVLAYLALMTDAYPPFRLEE